ncbi:MAG: hypothetical protein E7340_04320 [Clostridiales bacterium]|nr:hypothetical protein [Clostridiales bacterium]
MNKKHEYNFDGGRQFTSMGACWFVSYKYYLEVDKNHDNWKNCSTVDMRKSIFNNTKSLHDFWLLQVLKMDKNRLYSNALGIKGNKVIEMAKEILEKIN